jgi:putative hemolysin
MSKDRFPSPLSPLNDMFGSPWEQALAPSPPAAVPARPLASQNRGEFSIGLATSSHEIREAQRLRYKVFAEEMGANIRPGYDDDGRPIDVDMFDAYCDHLIVRDNNTEQVIGTYRFLAPPAAQKIGTLYSESEFFLTRLMPLREQMVEVGRSCVHQDYRTGSVIMLLWKGIAQYMQAGGYEYLMGCASISMRDGGHAAASIYHQLAATHSAAAEFQVFPRLALPIDKLDKHLCVEPPPLLKGYLRLGGKICGAPAWDPDFNTADLLILVSLSQMSARYRKHFFGA